MLIFESLHSSTQIAIIEHEHLIDKLACASVHTQFLGQLAHAQSVIWSDMKSLIIASQILNLCVEVNKPEFGQRAGGCRRRRRRWGSNLFAMTEVAKCDTPQTYECKNSDSADGFDFII